MNVAKTIVKAPPVISLLLFIKHYFWKDIRAHGLFSTGKPKNLNFIFS